MINVTISTGTFKCVRPRETRDVLRVKMEDESLTTVLEHLSSAIHNLADCQHGKRVRRKGVEGVELPERAGSGHEDEQDDVGDDEPVSEEATLATNTEE